MIERDAREREEAAFAKTCQYFINQWAPESPVERAVFSAELMTVLQRGMLMAQAPLLKQLTDIAMMAPVFSPTRVP
jgi:hypothetical protein